jgi:hypothetical protein
MTLLAQDTFIRPNQPSGNVWGVSSDGKSWSQVRGTQALTLTSNEGVMTFSTTTTGIMALGTGTSASVEGLVRFSVSTLTDLAGISLRFQDSNNFYSCVVGNTSQTLTFRKDVASTFSTVGTAVAFTYSITTFYWMRFRIDGNILRASAWLDGTTEPFWMMTAIDTSISAAGRYGVVGTPTTTGNTTQYDHVSFDNLLPPTPIVLAAVTQPLPYIDRGMLSTVVYENRTFIPRALGGVYIPDDPTLLWVPRGIGSTTQIPTGGVLGCTLAGIGTLTGAWTLSTTLASTFAGVGQLSPTLSASLSLICTFAGVGTLTETLSLATALSSTCAGVGTLTGTLSAATSLSVEFDGVGTLSGALSANTALTDTFAGVGTLSGTLSANTALAVTLAGVGTLSGTLSTTGGGSASLSVTLAGVGTLSGTLTAKTALTSTLAGSGTLAGTLILSTALANTLAGTGALSGVFSLQTALSLICAGVGLLTPTLTIAGITMQFLTATWITRDGKATWVTRDEQTGWQTRDAQATWDTRDDKATWDTRDEQALWKSRG